MHVASCDPSGKTEGSSDRGLTARRSFTTHGYLPYLGTTPGTCVDRDSWRSLRQAWSAVSVWILGIGVDIVSRQPGGLIDPDFCVDRRRPLNGRARCPIGMHRALI